MVLILSLAKPLMKSEVLSVLKSKTYTTAENLNKMFTVF